MISALIDSVVILDLFFDRKPYSMYSEKVLDLCERKKIKGYITPLILSNIYYLLRKKHTHKNVISKLNKLCELADILMINGEISRQALNSNFTAFEDALQNYSAESFKKISLIITRNVKDYSKSELSVMTPETFTKSV